MAVRGNSLWVAENTGSVLVIDLTVSCLGSAPHATELTTSPDERDGFDLSMPPGAPHHLRIRGQSSGVRGREDRDYWFMGQSINVVNSCS